MPHVISGTAIRHSTPQPYRARRDGCGNTQGGPSNSEALARIVLRICVLWRLFSEGETGRKGFVDDHDVLTTSMDNSSSFFR